MRKEKAFTLIELLVVIAIIALLVSILVPSLTRARDMAKKAVCSATISNHGKSIAMYMSLYDSYPILSPWPWMSPPFTTTDPVTSDIQQTLGWPTFYGILEMNDLNGSDRTTWGIWYYGAPVDQIWDGCLCPSMDAPAIWAAQDNAANLSMGTYGEPLWWMSFHKWAVGYQFSQYLRSATPMGRYPNRPGPAALWENVVDCYQWIMGSVNLLAPADADTYYIQAVNDEELGQASTVAAGWDGWDLESLPSVPYLTETVSEISTAMLPGWHAGPPTSGGRAIFNGYRHKSSPNILYADGHVAADANTPIDPVADGWVANNPQYAGMEAYTFNHFIRILWGNLDRVVPVAEMEE